MPYPSESVSRDRVLSMPGYELRAQTSTQEGIPANELPGYGLYQSRHLLDYKQSIEDRTNHRYTSVRRHKNESA